MTDADTTMLSDEALRGIAESVLREGRRVREPAGWPAGHYTKDGVRDLMLADDNWLAAAVVALYDFQTFREKKFLRTRKLNFVGFNQPDADFLTRTAEDLIRTRTVTADGKRFDYWLAPEIAGAVRARMEKYAAQVAAIANGRQTKRDTNKVARRSRYRD